MKRVHKKQAFFLLITVMIIAVSVYLFSFGANKKISIQDQVIQSIFYQSGFLKKIVSRASILGWDYSDLSMRPQASGSLQSIYPDLFPNTSLLGGRLNWQMGRAGGKIIFFLDDIDVKTCTQINKNLQFNGDIPDGLWSKLDLLNNRAMYPLPNIPEMLKNQGCMKTPFANYLYYDVM